ncbi:MAG: GTP-binding protein [Methylococcaceae bacterium]
MQAKEIKIVFTGSFGSGKVQAITQLSEVLVTTTKTMSYGELSLDENKKLNLYSTIGEKRFDSIICPVLCRGALGLIILIDNSQVNPLQELEYYLDINIDFVVKMPTIIGITHCDIASEPNLNNYQDFLNNKKLSLSLLKVDLRRRMDVLLLLEALVLEIEKKHITLTL